MTTTGMILLAAFAVKMVAISNAIRWLASHGDKHAKELQRHRENNSLTDDNYFHCFESHAGGFWPFGVKDYKLRRLIKRVREPFHPVGRTQAWLRRAAARVIDIGRLALFQYVVLSFVTTFYLMISAIAFRFPNSTGLEITDLERNIILALVAATFVTNFLMAVEFVCGHLFLTDYALYFHMLSPTKTVLAGKSQVAVGLQVLIMLALVILLTGLAAVFATHLLFGGFGGGALDQFTNLQLSDLPSVFGFCAYFTLTTLTTTGFGDVVPKTGVGAAVASGLQIEAMAIVVFGLAAFWSMRPISSD